MYFFYTDIIGVKEVAQMIGKKDERTARKWLENRGIPLTSNGREVFKFHVELQLKLELIDGLILKYPISWSKLVTIYVDDPKMVEAIFELRPAPVCTTTPRKTTKRNYIQ